jgi:hypothetical protein
LIKVENKWKIFWNLRQYLYATSPSLLVPSHGVYPAFKREAFRFNPWLGVEYMVEVMCFYLEAWKKVQAIKKPLHLSMRGFF